MADPMNHPDMSDFHKINITANQTDPVAFDKSGKRSDIHLISYCV